MRSVRPRDEKAFPSEHPRAHILEERKRQLMRSAPQRTHHNNFFAIFDN
jgi:hypothetical protein